jgi:hypothetical protein
VSAKLSRGRKSDAQRVLILNEEHALLFVVRLPTGADLDRQVLDVEREVSKLHDLLEGALELPAETHNGILLLRRPFVHRKPLLALLRFQADQVIQVETWRKERFLRAGVSEEEFVLVALLLVDGQLTHTHLQALRRHLQLWRDPRRLELIHCCEALRLEVDIDHPQHVSAHSHHHRYLRKPCTFTVKLARAIM